MKKPGWLRNAIAKPNGYYSPKGELLKRKALTQQECDAWNGVVAPKVEPIKEVSPTILAPTIEVKEAPFMEESKPVNINPFKAN